MKQEDLKKFLEKTPKEEKKQRAIHGRQMDYVDARYVADRLDEICGLGHWQTKVQEANYHGAPGYAFITTIEIWVDELEQWVGKTDGGAQDEIQNRGGQTVSPENDFKGALSDSFKRAAVQWGIARDLYQPEKYADTIDLDQPSQMPTVAPHSTGGVRTSEFPPTQPTEQIQSPVLGDTNGQASQEELKRLVQKKNAIFPYKEGQPQDPDSKAFFFWMKDQGLDFGKYDGNSKTRTDFNIPTNSVELIDAELDRLAQEPF